MPARKPASRLPPPASHGAPPASPVDPGIDSIAELQKRTFRFFQRELNQKNGLVRDNTRPDAPASVAGSGLALACRVAAVEHGYETRQAAAAESRKILEFFTNA